MLKLPNILTLSLLSYGLLFPSTLAIFPNREYRNDLLTELRQNSITYQFELCNLCYETINDLSAAATSNYLSENVGISEEEGATIANGMRTLLVSQSLMKEDKKKRKTDTRHFLFLFNRLEPPNPNMEQRRLARSFAL